MRRIAAAIWAGVLLAQIAPAGAAEAGYLLEVESLEGETVFSAPLGEGDAWCIHWNHSVVQRLVRECYRVVEGRMTLKRAHQPDLAAAGMGTIPGRGVMVPAPEGGYWIEDIDEPIAGNCLRMRVGSARVDHRVVLGESEHSLSALAPRQPMRIVLRAEGSEGEQSC